MGFGTGSRKCVNSTLAPLETASAPWALDPISRLSTTGQSPALS